MYMIFLDNGKFMDASGKNMLMSISENIHQTLVTTILIIFWKFLDVDMAMNLDINIDVDNRFFSLTDYFYTFDILVHKLKFCHQWQG